MTESKEKRTPYQNRVELLQGTLDMLILQTLQWGPQHGYGISQAIRIRSGEVLQVETGSLYPALQRMLREGLLESKEGVSAKGRPTRIYRLTRAGVRHLESQRSSFDQMFAGIARVLAVAEA